MRQSRNSFDAKLGTFIPIATVYSYSEESRKGFRRQGYIAHCYALAMAGKSLSPEQQKVAKAVLNRVLEDQFAGSQTDFAVALGIKQPTLSDVLSGKKGAGGKVLAGLMQIDAAAAAEIAGGKPPQKPRDIVPSASETSAPGDLREAALAILVDKHRVPYEDAKKALASVLAFDQAHHATAEQWAATALRIYRAIRGSVDGRVVREEF